jgi:hypothetical protein
MNKRIRELWAQAGGHYNSGNQHTWPQYTIDNPEKFAELIVRECMRESMDAIVADEEIAQEKDPLIRKYLTGNNQGIVDAVVRFRNHFGVNE